MKQKEVDSEGLGETQEVEGREGGMRKGWREKRSMGEKEEEGRGDVSERIRI